MDARADGPFNLYAHIARSMLPPLFREARVAGGGLKNDHYRYTQTMPADSNGHSRLRTKRVEMLPLDDEVSLPVSIGVVGPSLVVARVFDNDSTNRFNYITKWSSFLREHTVNTHRQ